MGRWLLKESTDVNAELTEEHGGIVETEEENRQIGQSSWYALQLIDLTRIVYLFTFKY